jgi:hypothetical protein
MLDFEDSLRARQQCEPGTVAPQSTPVRGTLETKQRLSQGSFAERDPHVSQPSTAPPPPLSPSSSAAPFTGRRSWPWRVLRAPFVFSASPPSYPLLRRPPRAWAARAWAPAPRVPRPPSLSADSSPGEAAAAAAAHPQRQAGGAVAVGGGVPLKQAAEEGGEGAGEAPPR